MRDRLEQVKVKSIRRGVLDIKYGAGGMLDVYFATRFLQLRDNVPDKGQDRSTLSTLASLKEANSLSTEDYEVLRSGYILLRSADHEQRLLQGRSARLPAPDHPVMRDIARKLKYESAVELIQALAENTACIRAAYARIIEL